MANLFHLLQRVCLLLEAIYQLLKDASLPLSGRQDEKVVSGTKARPLLSVIEVMDMLGISRSTYYRFVKEGRLLPRILGNRHYYYLEDLEEQIRESKRRGRI